MLARDFGGNGQLGGGAHRGCGSGVRLEGGGVYWSDIAGGSKVGTRGALGLAPARLT